MTVVPETTDEVFEWFAELYDITDGHIRRETADALFNAPDYFWTVPASQYHHPPDHRSRHGLVLHVKRTLTVLERLQESMVQQGHMTESNVDEARSALLLHDAYKYGEPPTETGTGTVGDHDVLARNWLNDNYDLPSNVTDAVASHNGAWYAGPQPQSHTAQMVHMSDMVASAEDIPNIAIKEPNDVLQERFPTVPTR